MKFKITLLALLFVALSGNVFSQINVETDVSNYHGYNVSCNGSSDGYITITPGGTYTYQWSNGATTTSISSLTAGNYSVIISDGSTNDTLNFSLTQPNALNVSLNAPLSFCNYNISQKGATDGSISSTVTGGDPSYSYSWSNGSHDATQYNLGAGNYMLTVTDVNGCVDTASITLIEPDSLKITSITKSTHGSYNVSCADGNDGSITITATGGSQPYHYTLVKPSVYLSNTTGIFDNLGPGTYYLYFWGCAGGEIDTTITLTSPSRISSSFTTSHYGNGTNVSCFSCSDGSATINVTGGVSPYTYVWKDTANVTLGTTNSITNVGAEQYSVTTTDSYGCSGTVTVTLTQPPRDNWSLKGNAHLDSTDYLGSQDSSTTASC